MTELKLQTKYLPITSYNNLNWKDVCFGGRPEEEFDYPRLEQELREMWKEHIYDNLHMNLHSFVNIEMLCEDTTELSLTAEGWDHKFKKIAKEQVICIIRELFKELGYKYFISITSKPDSDRYYIIASVLQL